ncbi:hypothetical protein [Streptomyces sp. NBRC 110611]|uniref:hypothetical protein n=1 Tax=Streptomyces sp. NBRC 110611 TaxID=1621259 RepID=UPI0011BFBA8C|nr:hypothetical protein [Streptomyces sp. NBRC 110611]
MPLLSGSSRAQTIAGAAQFTALRHSALDGTDHASHKEAGQQIRRYIICRNKHTVIERLRAVADLNR